MASQDWIEKDFYAILGVAKDASEADIKKAYRKLARKYHPDTNQGDAAAEQKFKDISEAHSVLADKEEREQYDAIRAMGSGARFSAGGPGGAPGGQAGFEDIFSNLFGGGGSARSRGGQPDFSDLFGGGGFGGGGFGQSAPPRKGADRTANTSISFAGSIKGTTIGLREQNGEVIDVRIPAGIKDGQSVRVRGKGQAGAAGNGDLLVKVKVSEHPFFKREENNIRIHVPVTFDEAVLGAKIHVPTLDGETVAMKVPAGSNSGRTLRLKGRGVKTSKATGDLLITLDVVIPQNLSDEAKKAVEDFAAATAGEDPRADLAAKAKL
ncbi:DnaJ C-terminal domain-containing protein [Arthrobacter sp. NIO-1057]|uniref:DnaJ C-terminal domain-containing protein n=1 Tax=Arthrobacter sp. NIO-1057 TaxID=993071 RepID=UPI00071DEACE|nr:DnaJ C-terminal domain-containing protein [Arthrobacter sp. NIO-1057]KSU64872.1 molecular chaperone DnaJ [Arthrobacter sp. NIO-1057]SCC49016.1 molecular chaperone DnaJ [Arthrobacter sp. NIO-1057]